MVKLHFSSFQKLLREVEKIDLYDSVKPELQEYAENRHGGIPIDQAYTLILEKNYRFSGGEGQAPTIGDPEGFVRRMGKGRDGRGSAYQTARIHVERMYFFFLFSDDVDPTAYAQRINTRLFGQSFFDEFARELRSLGVERPDSLPASSRVKLGCVEISLGDDNNLLPFRLDWHEKPKLADVEGKPAVYAAMHWRSGLSQLHGRLDEYAKIWDWALDDSKLVKTMLISGPGGAGKTRLAAEVVRNLVARQSWKGGFLLDGFDNNPGVYDGSGAGIVFAIDYPEEKTQAVKDILAAAGNSVMYGKPIRIILISRENRGSWLKILNKVQLDRFDETPLDLKRYVSKEDALEIANDVKEYYPELIGMPKADFVGVDEWLDRHEAHRLPLNIVAASVHAVLDPSHAFKLDGAAVLTALAEWELRRVRYYSERDLGARYDLEKLCALSLFTEYGLLKETIYELGRHGICPGKSGDALLDALRRTPFWRPKTEHVQSHLIKLEPDRPAAIFCLKALSLDDPSPGLSNWLIAPAIQDSDGFGDRVNRLAFDVSQANPSAGLALEQVCVGMLRIKPELVTKFRPLAHKFTPFSAKFSLEICKRLLDATVDLDTRATLMNNQAFILSQLGQQESALETVQNAVNIVQPLAVEHAHAYKRQLGVLMTTQATVLSRLGLHKAAVTSIETAVSINRELLLEGFSSILADLAKSLHNRSNMLFSVGDRENALISIQEAVSIYQGLAMIDAGTFIPQLTLSLNNQATLLAQAGQKENAAIIINEAVSNFEPLVVDQPDILMPDLGTLLHTQATILFDMGQHEAALKAIERAVSLRRSLMASRPDAFLKDLARSLSTQSSMLFYVDKHEAALNAIREAIRLRRSLVAERPDASIHDLALSLRNYIKMLMELGKNKEALSISAEAISLLRPYFFENPHGEKELMAMLCFIYWELCESNETQPDLELLTPIHEILLKMEK